MQLLLWMLSLSLLLGSCQAKRLELKEQDSKGFNNHFKMAAPSFLSALAKNPAKSEVEEKTKNFDFATLMGKHGLMLKEMAEEEGSEESLEDETEDVIQTVQNKNMKPLQGSWYWNPINMTFSWSIQRPMGSSDNYTLAFKEEGIEFDKAEGFGESEENDPEDSQESEEVSGPTKGEEEYDCQEDGVMYMHRKFPDAPAGLRYRKTDTWQECQKVCAEVEPCKGFMWHKKNNKYAKLCLLFSTHNGKIKGTAVSGPKECPKDTVCDGSEDPQIVASTSNGCPGTRLCGMFPASAIFSLGKDKAVGHNKHNFWLAPNNRTGPEQGFTLDLGCAQKAVGIRLKNTHNQRHKDRGTKKFRLLGSRRSVEGPWQMILEANLEDSRLQRSPPVKQLLFETPLLVRFVKFELLEFWGKGGGLQHLSVLAEDDAGVHPREGGDYELETELENLFDEDAFVGDDYAV